MPKIKISNIYIFLFFLRGGWGERMVLSPDGSHKHKVVPFLVALLRAEQHQPQTGEHNGRGKSHQIEPCMGQQGGGCREVQSVLSYETGYIRRRLSQTLVVSFGQRMLARMNQVGLNATMASKRRQWQSREEERARLDREGTWFKKVQGSSIVQRGRFLKHNNLDHKDLSHNSTFRSSFLQLYSCVYIFNIT